MKGFFLLLILGLILFSSCKDEKTGFITERGTESTTSGPEKVQKVDILIPETPIEESEETKKISINELYDIFFKTFVLTVEGGDTRINFKRMHELRISQDKDFLNLVGLIEKRMATTDPETLDLPEKKAFYINAYNFASIRLVNKGYLQKGKIITSIRDLSNPIFKNDILERSTILLRDGTHSLDSILKNKIKPLFFPKKGELDPRFVLALNGATMSRGLLLNRAYQATSLEEQLNEVNTKALSLSRFAKIEDKELKAAKVLKWYRKEIEQAYGSMEVFFGTFGIDESLYHKIDYQSFNWDLNSMALYPAPLEVQKTPDLPEIIEDQPSVLGEKPCEFLKSENVEVIAHCNQVFQGNLEGALRYKVTVESASLCLYKRELTDGEYSMGIVGDITETDQDGRLESLSLSVEGEMDDKGEEYRMRIVEKVVSTLEYEKSSKRLMVRQTRNVLRGLRKFSLQCE